MTSTEAVLDYLASIADPEGLVHGINARMISQVIWLSYDQTKRAIIDLMVAGIIDRLNEQTNGVSDFVIYSLALEAARSEESE